VSVVVPALFFIGNCAILRVATSPNKEIKQEMRLAIIGSRACGKTTLFAAMSGIPAGGPNRSTAAVVDVPDERVDRLSAVFHPRKTVYGRIEVCDTDSISEGDMKKEAVPAKQLQQMRLSDAFLVVLKDFDDGAPARPAADFHSLLAEFIIDDMVQIENRLERIKKQGGKKEAPMLEQEKAVLSQCLAHLDAGSPLSTLDLPGSDEKALRGFQFLSRKPLMVVVNRSEEAMGRSDADGVAAEAGAALLGAAPVISACASLEAELVMMAPDERAAFMEEYWIAESLRGRLIRLAYETLGLVSFLTVGEDECRAWPIRKGMTAQEAAGAIHTDLSDKFIRAETVAYADFMRYGGFPACKKAGVWRLEGKQYVVQDGDILSIRAGN
jgi:GTP-binding protein YchF